MERCLALASILMLLGCPGGSSGPVDASVFDYTKVNTGADKKALIYNLVGRWFPEAEIKRLDDETMTPEEWCAREATRIEVFLDDVEVYCGDGAHYSSPIARVDRADDGGIMLVMRASEDSKLKSLTFTEVISRSEDPNRPKATIIGSPCGKGAAESFGRFPRIEVLERQILDGRQCAQIRKE